MPPELTHRYLAYGMRISSELELWTTHEADFAADWLPDVRVEWVAALPEPPATPAHWARSHRFDWPGLAEMLVEDGRRISVCAVPDADPSELAAAVTGPALAAALGQRERLVLHGTCVGFEHGALCLLGDSGAGKSTLAAALCGAGGALVSDTMTVITLGQGQPTVQVGPAQLKLWPNSAQALGYGPDTFAGGVAGSEKAVHRFLGEMASSSIKLSRIFLLAARGPVCVEPLGPAAAVARLLQNHFLVAYLDDDQRKHWLPACARLTESTCVQALHRGATLLDLSDAVNALKA